jgi:hypothetical protein
MQLPFADTAYAICVRIDRCTTCAGDLELDGPRCAAVITTRKTVLLVVCLVILCWEPDSAFALLGLRLLSQEMKQEMMAIQYILCSFDTYAKPMSSFFFSSYLFL